MAEHKACADLVALTGDSVANSGECRSPIDDSGTESGEDFRLLSPEILAEVQSALTRLEAALPGLDPARREALIRLVNRLQSCLKLQPASQTSTPPNPPPPQPPPPQPPVRRYANRRQRHQRHTVGVSKEELADARRWLQETRQQSAASTENPSEAPSVESHSSTNLNELQEDVPKPVLQVFRPVKFNPNQSKGDKSFETVNQSQSFERSDSQEEPNCVNPISTYTYPQDVSKADSGSSLLEYDPSLTLFTPSQSVQIAIHKAAINKQISEEESKRENSKREESYDSEDGDISSVEEDHSLAMGQDGLEDAISSAQRLLQIATDNKNTSSHGRFQDRNSKKQKMKRANTIDIPKPANAYDGSSPDEFDMSTSHMKDKDHKYSESEQKVPPPFEPKTESDLKFLAFLQKSSSSNNSEAKAGIYNPSARGGQPWTNRFVNIKTAFEKPTSENIQTTQNKSDPPPITQNWLNNSSKQPEPGVVRQGVNRTPQPLQTKLPWTSREEENGVVVGSLTVKPSPLTPTHKPFSPVNKFYHAPKSAFKPIEKKPLTQVQIFETTQKPVVQKALKPFNASYQSPHKNKQNENKKSQHKMSKMTSSASGSVKQLATQKFSGENISSKPIIKQYPVIQDKQFNAANSVKQHPFVDQLSKPSDKSASVAPPPPPQFASSIASTQKQLFDHTTHDPKIVKIPQNKTLKEFKDGTKFSPPKQYINSPPPFNKQHSDPFQYPSDGKNGNTLLATQSKSDSLPELDNIPYYSQEPAYVQHTSYIQPYDGFSPQQTYLPSQSHFASDAYDQYSTPTEPAEEYPVNYNQQHETFSQPEQVRYLYDVSSKFSNDIVQPHSNHDRGGQTSLPYVPAFKEEPVHHRFSEESLVPNPLVLSDVLIKSPVQFPQYDFSSTQPSPPVKPNIPAITNTQYENTSSHSSLTSSKLSDSSSSMKQFLNVPYDYGLGKSPVINNNSKSPYFDESSNSSPTRSPHLNPEEDEEREISLSEGTEIQTAVAKVMGHAQCQKAVTVPSRKQHCFDDERTESDSLLRTLLKSPHSPTNMARKQSLDKSSAFTEIHEPTKTTVDKPLQNKQYEDTYSHPIAEKIPAYSKAAQPPISPEKPTQNRQYQDTYSYPTVVKIPVFTAQEKPAQPSKPPENHTQSRQYRDVYSYPTVAKAPVVVSPQNDREKNYQNKPISSAASAFRPLVNNLAKTPQSFGDRLPPVPSSPPSFGRKFDGDSSRLANTSTKVLSQNTSYSSRYYESDISPKPPPNVSPSKSPTLRSSTSPSFPNVLQKSESWHQLVKEQKAQGRHPPPKSPRLAKTKSSHSLAFPKQFEAHLTPDTVAVKQSTVDQYLKPQMRQSLKTTKQKKTVSIVKLDENLENVDEAFESLFQEVAKRK